MGARRMCIVHPRSAIRECHDNGANHAPTHPSGEVQQGKALGNDSSKRNVVIVTLDISLWENCFDNWGTIQDYIWHVHYFLEQYNAFSLYSLATSVRRVARKAEQLLVHACNATNLAVSNTSMWPAPSRWDFCVKKRAIIWTMSSTAVIASTTSPSW